MLNNSLTWKETTKPTQLNEVVTFEHLSQYVLEASSLCNLTLKFTTKQQLTKGNDYELLSLSGFTPDHVQCNAFIYCDTNVVAVAVKPDKKVVLRALISDIPVNYQLSCQCIYKF